MPVCFSIISGVIYNDNGHLVIDSIKANEIRINTRSNSITITDGMTARFYSDTSKNKIAAELGSVTGAFSIGMKF
mgnify:CR=1 FL=1